MDKQARIAAAARALFEERGFEGTTIRAIAERAGVASGTVLLYGESKTELLTALFVDEIEEVAEAQLSTLDRSLPLVDQLVWLLSGFLRRYASHPALSRIYVKETLFLPPSPQVHRNEAMTRRFLEQLTETVAGYGGLRDDVDPAVVAGAAFGLYLLQAVEVLRVGSVDPEPAIAALRAAITGLVRPLVR